ncbi:hypothetical protein SFC55_09780 [Niallia taxi]|uniref:hypothetical protein n=1 Tax=Niallia taxi TaxID=2499688 RepID=UPI0039820A09
MTKVGRLFEEVRLFQRQKKSKIYNLQSLIGMYYILKKTGLAVDEVKILKQEKNIH